VDAVAGCGILGKAHVTKIRRPLKADKYRPDSTTGSPEESCRIARLVAWADTTR
jgi:hypothetical protein